jgi:hypothetical protein
MKLTIGWLYPSKMNIYGDRGNVLALAQRARWRGLDAEIARSGSGILSRRRSTSSSSAAARIRSRCPSPATSMGQRARR